MRRIASTLGVVGLGLLLIAPQALAGESVTSGRYKGSTITTTSPTASSAPAITGRIERERVALGNNLDPFVTAQFLAPAGLGAACTTGIPSNELDPIDADGNDNDDDGIDEWTVSTTATATCNGTYTIILKAQTCPPTGVGCTDSAVMEKHLVVAGPPAKVEGVRAAAAPDRSVTVTWDLSTGMAPDFTGYQVERQDASGEWTVLAKPKPTQSSFVDTTVPPAGGTFTYRVLGRRSTNGGSDIVSDGGGRSNELTIAGDGTTTSSTPPATDGGPGGGTEGGADGGTGTGGTGGTGGGTGGSAGTSVGGPRGRTGVGTRAPRLGVSTQANFPPLLGVDEEEGGFSEELPFDQGGLAGEDDDDFASLIYEDENGRGMAVPVATGFVLLAWAFHLRFLARAARPAR